MTIKKKLKVPKSNKRDTVHKAGKVLIAAGGAYASWATGIPGFPLAAELYSLILRPPLTRKTEQFMSDLYEIIISHEEQIEQFRQESLRQNDFAVSMIWRATLMASYNKQEKFQYLQNAVLNTILEIDIDEEEKHVFFDLIDGLTHTHIKALRFLSEERETMPDISGKHFVQVFIRRYPEYEGREEFLGQRIDEIADKALIETSEVGSDTRGVIRHVKPPYLTKMGERFLRFISTPAVLRVTK